MKLYLAAMFAKKDEMKGYADQLADDGHEITANWVYGGETGLTLTDIADLDVNDVIRADGIVSFTEPYGSINKGGGRHSELGMGIIIQKLIRPEYKMFIVGEREQVFHWRANIVQFPSFILLRNHLKNPIYFKPLSPAFYPPVNTSLQITQTS